MNYEVNGITYDADSPKNQRIADKLVDREVYCCMTSEVEYMLSKVYDYDDDNPFDEDDLEVTFVPYCSKCGSTYGMERKETIDLMDEELERDEGWETGQDGYLCPICGGWFETVQEAKECCGLDSEVYKCNECGTVHNVDDVDNKQEEIYEWWAVSKWFGEKLQQQGCAVIESYSKSYWGRTTTGQCISLDSCVVNIAKEMGILEGMEFEWKC